MSNERRTFSDTAVSTTLSGAINDTVEAFTMASGTGWPTGSGGDFFASITNATSGAVELLRCSARTGGSVTVASGGRGYGSTVASTYSGGETVKHVLSAEYDANEANLAVYQLLSQATAAGQVPIVSGTAAYTMVQSKTSGQILVGNGTTSASVAVSGDVTLASTGAVTIANDAVTYAKMQNVSATDRLLGRDTAGSGNTEELTVTGGLEFTGSTGIQRSALTGAVTASAGSGTTAFASGTQPTLAATSAPSGATGQLWYDTDDNLLYAYNSSGAWVCITPMNASVATAQTTASTSYTDLATSGPAVSVVTGTKAIVTLSCRGENATAGDASYMGFAVSGATTVAAADTSSVEQPAAFADYPASATKVVYVTGLTAGTNTFTAKYKADAGTAKFRDRVISVVGIP